jgi:hypothetical protein
MFFFFFDMPTAFELCFLAAFFGAETLFCCTAARTGEAAFGTPGTAAAGAVHPQTAQRASGPSGLPQFPQNLCFTTGADLACTRGVHPHFRQRSSVPKGLPQFPQN